MHTLRLGILGSGSGSNCQALMDAIASGTLNAHIAIVMSDVPHALILERARRAGIATATIECQGYRNLFPLEAQQHTADVLKQHDVDLVCLAGFMRLIKTPLLDAFPRRIINIHPSLLPAFPGVAAWQQAIDAGATESGCTVHYVDAGMDTGPIILQERVPILPDDTASCLHQRIQNAEHSLYPAAVRLLANQQMGSFEPIDH